MRNYDTYTYIFCVALRFGPMSLFIIEKFSEITPSFEVEIIDVSMSCDVVFLEIT